MRTFFMEAENNRPKQNKKDRPPMNKTPYRFKLDGSTFQIDSDQTVWKIAKTQKGHEAFHLMLGPDADHVLRYGRAQQWTEQRNREENLKIVAWMASENHN